MPMKEDTNKNQSNVNVGNISGVSGDVKIAGRDITNIHNSSGLSAAEIQQLFDRLYTHIDTQSKTSPADKEDLKAEVEEIQSTVTEAVKKKEAVEESFLSRRFRNIARIAPDVLDVVVATLGSPLAGLGVVAKKIAERAKEEAAARG